MKRDFCGMLDEGEVCMAYRLVGRISGIEVHLDVGDESAILGASSSCDLRVDHPTVSRRHLQLTPTAEGLRIRDLDSKNGTWIGNVRVHEGIVAPGGSIRLGQVELLVEPLDPGSFPDEVHSGTLTRPDLARPRFGGGGSAPNAGGSVGTNAFECFVTGAMRDALDELDDGRDLEKLAAIVGHGLSSCLPLSTVEIGWKTPGTGATLYCRRQDGVEFSSQQITRTRGELYLYCAFKNIPEISDLEALLDVALGLVVLGEGSTLGGETG
jgi:pSer/pThr/pTyr-binding forkhead associated (FHA) protein